MVYFVSFLALSLLGAFRISPCTDLLQRVTKKKPNCKSDLSMDRSFSFARISHSQIREMNLWESINTYESKSSRMVIDHWSTLNFSPTPRVSTAHPNQESRNSRFHKGEPAAKTADWSIFGRQNDLAQRCTLYPFLVLQKSHQTDQPHLPCRHFFFISKLPIFVLILSCDSIPRSVRSISNRM